MGSVDVIPTLTHFSVLERSEIYSPSTISSLNNSHLQPQGPEHSSLTLCVSQDWGDQLLLSVLRAESKEAFFWSLSCGIC